MGNKKINRLESLDEIIKMILIKQLIKKQLYTKEAASIILAVPDMKK